MTKVGVCNICMIRFHTDPVTGQENSGLGMYPAVDGAVGGNEPTGASSHLR